MQFLRGEKDANKRISQAQSKAEQEAMQTVKLLILGAGGSGKTTLRKQFQRLYASGFKDPASRLELANVIRFNLLEGARATVTASFDEAISGGGLVASDSLSAAALLNKLPEGCTTLDDATAGAIKTLWKDAAFQKTLSNSSKFQLQECVVPFLQECQEYPAWGGAKWVPSIDDCVRSRIRSSGIIEVEFEYEGVKFKVLDAGGQRAERRKWIHAFEDVTALIFVASLTEYDETLYEDHSKNRLQESLEVWGDVTNNAAFVATPVLLFLNKMDLFVEKYVRRGTPLNASGCFPGAPAYTPNFPLAIEWIKEQFKSRRTKSDPSLLYIHTTTAVDPAQVDVVFKDVKRITMMRGQPGMMA